MKSLLDAVAARREVATNRYLIEIEFTHRILGTQPKSPDVMKKWLEAVHVEPDVIEKQLAQLPAAENIANAEKEAWTGFYADDIGPYIGTYQVKAMLREMLTTLGITVTKRGSKQTYQHLLEVVACENDGVVLEGVQSERLHFLKDADKLGDVFAREPHGDITMTAHVQTAQGPRSVIKRHDYIEGARLRFLIVLPAMMPDGRASAVIGDEELVKIFAHAGNDGLGCSRSQGFGRFTLVRLDKLTDNPGVDPASKKKKPSKNAEPTEHGDGEPEES